MRPFPLLSAAYLVISSSSCGLSYQQRQDRYRERYLRGCQVIHTRATSEPRLIDSSERPEITDVVAGSSAEVQRCYLESRELWANLEGQVAVKFTVKPNGTVGDPTVVMYHSTVAEAAVGCCIARIAQTWSFPKPEAGKSFDVEHVFDLQTDMFKIGFRPTSNVGKPQPASGTEIHQVW